MARRTSKKKPAGWRKEWDRHALASKGIKTTLTKVKDGNKKVLPKDWLKKRIDRQPYRGRIKKWASNLYDEIGDKLESGEYIIKDGELKEIIDYYKFSGKEYLSIPYINTHPLMKGIDDWGDEVRRVDSFKGDDGDLITYIAYYLRNTLRPIEDWLSANYDMALDIYNYRGESVHCELYDKRLEGRLYETFNEPDKDDKELLLYIADNISDRVEGTSEFDLEFQERVSKAYMDSKHKTEFKDKVANFVQSEISIISDEFYNNISNALKGNKLDKYVNKRNKKINGE